MSSQEATWLGCLMLAVYPITAFAFECCLFGARWRHVPESGKLRAVLLVLRVVAAVLVVFDIFALDATTSAWLYLSSTPNGFFMMFIGVGCVTMLGDAIRMCFSTPAADDHDEHATEAPVQHLDQVLERRTWQCADDLRHVASRLGIYAPLLASLVTLYVAFLNSAITMVMVWVFVASLLLRAVEGCSELHYAQLRSPSPRRSPQQQQHVAIQLPPLPPSALQFVASIVVAAEPT